MITVLCPTYQEERYITGVLEFFVKALPLEKELYIIDGLSKDKTREIVQKYMKEYPDQIFLLDNPDKYVPYALNKGLEMAKGEIIVRLDAHTEYASDYFLKILETFKETGADIVGGPMRAVGKTPFQRAVAHATSAIFGVGDSHFHNEDYEGWVDSVYLGAWKTEIFSEVGNFDTRMVRNQDDEFHYRARSKGKKIYLSPKIKSEYFPRSNYRTLFKQYFQYGYYKPLVLKKVRSEIKLRHLVPAGFFLYLLTLPVSFWFPVILIPMVLYISLSLYFGFRMNGTLGEKLLASSIFLVLHISYGAGFILGLDKK